MANKMLHGTVPKRIISRIDVKNGMAVKGIMMEGVRPVGDPTIMSRKYFRQGIDEIILLDTVASLYKRTELPNIIAEIVKDIFIPVCAGGGVTSCLEAEKLFYSGADKVCINSGAIQNPSLLRDLSQEFGSQAIVLQLDARLLNSEFRAFYNTGRELSDFKIPELLNISQDNGIGEIIVTSIEKDGTGKGPDLGLIELVDQHVKVPIIYGGGVSSTNQINSLFSETNISGVALASYLHIDYKSVGDIKSSLKLAGHTIRQDITL
jgi:cyclase